MLVGVGYVNEARTLKGYRSGTHCAISPTETVARVKPCLAAMGITRVANVTGLDTIGNPVVMAWHPNSSSQAVPQGKSLDLDAAKASAGMECVEGYHSENVELALKLATCRELRAHDAVVDMDSFPRCWKSNFFHPNLPLYRVEGEDWLQHEKV